MKRNFRILLAFRVDLHTRQQFFILTLENFVSQSAALQQYLKEFAEGRKVRRALSKEQALPLTTGIRL